MGSSLKAKSLRKAVVPSTLLDNPSPGNLQSTRLALYVNEDASSCWVYIASGCNIYKLLIPLEDSSLSTGKQGLLIPEQTEVMDSLLLKRCPHRSEIQSIVLTEIESTGYLVLACVDAYGHLIVSKLDASGKDFDKTTYSVLPRDFGVGEGSWSGVCFSPIQWSMAAVARSFCKTVDVYVQDIHLRTLRTLWYPSSLNFMRNLGHGNENSLLSVTEGCQITGLAFSSLDSDYIYVQGVDYEVFCGQWQENNKVFSFRGDSNWLGFSKCSNRDILGGWSDSGSIFVADVVAKGE